MLKASYRGLSLALERLSPVIAATPQEHESHSSPSGLYVIGEELAHLFEEDRPCPSHARSRVSAARRCYSRATSSDIRACSAPSFPARRSSSSVCCGASTGARHVSSSSMAPVSGRSL